MKNKIGIFLYFFLCTTLLSANTLDSAKEFINAKNYSQALVTLNAVVNNEPGNVEALYYLALNHYLLGNYEQTLKYGVQAYTRDHTLAKEIRQYSNQEKFGIDLKIGLFRKIRLAKQLRNELYLVLQNEPDNVNAHYVLGYYYIFTPYLLSGSIKKSLSHIEQVAKSDMQRAHPIYSAYYKKTKNSKQYSENLSQWYKDYPEDWSALIELARAEQDKNNHLKSYTLLSQWLEKNPQDAKAIYQVGRLSATTGSYLEQGENSLIQYLSMPRDIDNPEYKWAHYRLAMIYQHLDKSLEAQEHISKALEIDPKNDEFLKLKSKL